MFNFFKKKKNDEKKVSIASPVNGKVVKLEEVPDPVFAEKMVGDGFAVIPSDGEVFAPVSGEVTLQPDGYHAIGIKTDEGIEVLVHFGLETVELKGDGFTPHVKVGDRVNKGDKVLSVDIEKIKDNYKDANHNCSAYIINEKPEIKRYSDDGEPQGSAGLPMLSVLEKEELFNLVAVVTRYFGGKKLGKGGLVRAYTKGVSDCLEGKITYRKVFIESKITFDYNLLGIIENFLNEENYIIIEKNFLQNVSIDLYIEENNFEYFKKRLIDMTSSNIEIEKIDKIMLYDK